jgi:hypothetical protein
MMKRTREPRTKWVKIGMHHDCDYWIQIAEFADGLAMLQRYSGIQHVPIGGPDMLIVAGMERRVRK